MCETKNIFRRGLEDTLEIQRRFNELDHLMWRQVQLNASEDPIERVRQITALQSEFKQSVDELLTPDTRVTK
jgi:hypothetical protein